MRIAKPIAEFISTVREGRDYYEPFCGSCNVTTKLSGTRVCSDVNKSLITMWQHLQKGWIPPESVSEEDYRKLQAKKDPYDPMTAFAGFGSSFGARFFEGYARGAGRNFAREAKNSLAKKLVYLQDVKFLHRSYESLEVSRAIMYCDPPYEGTKPFSGTTAINYEHFWNWCREMSRTNTVLVSSYVAPEDFKAVLAINVTTDMSTSTGKSQRVEKVFTLCT